MHCRGPTRWSQPSKAGSSLAGGCLGSIGGKPGPGKSGVSHGRTVARQQARRLIRRSRFRLREHLDEKSSTDSGRSLKNRATLIEQRGPVLHDRGSGSTVHVAAVLRSHATSQDPRPGGGGANVDPDLCQKHTDTRLSSATATAIGGGHGGCTGSWRLIARPGICALAPRIHHRVPRPFARSFATATSLRHPPI